MEKCEVLTALQERELIDLVDPIGAYVYSHAEVVKIESSSKSEWKATRNAVIVLLMSDAGLRVGEVVQLLYSDCYYDSKPVLKLTVRAEIAKGGFEREVPFTSRLIFALKRYRTENEFDGFQKSNLPMITKTQFGARLSPRGVEKFIEKVGKKDLGIRLYPHMLRHTFATKLMRITDIPTVQKILGHKHLSSTEIYMHPNSEDVDLAIKSMEAGSRQQPALPAGKSGGAMRLGRTPGTRQDHVQGDNQGETEKHPK